MIALSRAAQADQQALPGRVEGEPLDVESAVILDVADLRRVLEGLVLRADGLAQPAHHLEVDDLLAVQGKAHQLFALVRALAVVLS